MCLDEIFAYAVVAVCGGLSFALMVRAWRRPFFRLPRKETLSCVAWFPAPLGGYRRRK